MISLVRREREGERGNDDQGTEQRRSCFYIECIRSILCALIPVYWIVLIVNTINRPSISSPASSLLDHIDHYSLSTVSDWLHGASGMYFPLCGKKTSRDCNA